MVGKWISGNIQLTKFPGKLIRQGCRGVWVGVGKNAQVSPASRGVLDAARRGALCTCVHASTSHHWGLRVGLLPQSATRDSRGRSPLGGNRVLLPGGPGAQIWPRGTASRGPSKAGTTNDLPIPSSRPYGLCKTVPAVRTPVHPHGTPLLPRSLQQLGPPSHV